MVKNNSNKMPSQRQLRVGEEIRHALSDIFLREDFYTDSGKDIKVTISEVRVSPDLRNATVYSMPLGGEDKESIMPFLQELEPRVRHLLSQKVRMKYLPRLAFKEDVSFERANTVEKILYQERGNSTSTDDNTH